MFSEDLKTLRSNFLVHWTGRDLEERYIFHPFPIEVKRAEYVQRLTGTLKEGLWMNDVDIELHGLFDSSSYIRSLTFQWPATCLTEIKFSKIQKHAERYGYLGFGFTRQFVMDRYGAPVLYVPGVKESRDLDTISPHLLKLYEVLDFFASETNDNFEPSHVYPKLTLNKFMESIDFKQFLMDHGYCRESQDLCKIFEYLHASVITVAIFVKRMSDEKCKYKFELLDEAEWRIPYIIPGKSRSLIKPPIEGVNPIGSKENPKAKIPFYPNDLKVLIFPDDETRRMALDDGYFQCWLKKRGGFPVMATVDECEQF